MSASLYGDRDPSNTKTKHKPISSSSSLAFSSNLSALISSSKTTSSGEKRTKSSTGKSSIFNAHNKNVRKRAAADENEPNHQTSQRIGHATASELHQSKRKMLEKTRLYNAMKRGEFIGGSEYSDRGLVDFDKKWADAQNGASGHSDGDSDSEMSSHPSDEEVGPVEWTDEFGRLRTGTGLEKRRFEREQRIAAAAAAEEEAVRARPAAPENIIYGDTIQRDAFNPDTVVADRMAELAEKRDKEDTPPPDAHYDGNAEVRTKGTGFYGFSHNADERKREMDALEKERAETERKRTEREEVKEQRRKEVEQRRKMLAEKRSRKEANRFLEELGDADSLRGDLIPENQP